MAYRSSRGILVCAVMRLEDMEEIFEEYRRTSGLVRECRIRKRFKNSSSLITRHPRGCFQKGSNQQQARKATKPKLTHVTLYMWWLSEEERRVDALALRADERRDKLRKASGRSKYPLIRRSLNGETHLDRLQVSIRQSITYGGEPGELKHLSSRRKRKKHRYRE